jgi:excisionase family DNA binding protein
MRCLSALFDALPPKMSDNLALLTFRLPIRHYRHQNIDFLLSKWHNQCRVMTMLKTEDGRFWTTVKEAAQRLQVSPSRLVKAVKEGKIDALRLSPRAILIDWQQAQYWRQRFYSERKAQVARERRKQP